MENYFKKHLNYFNFENILKKYTVNNFIIFILFLAFIIYLRKTNYILSHSILETLNSATCFSLVILVINNYRISKNNYFIYLCIVFGFVAFFNFFHTIAYMGVFNSSRNPTNLSMQIYIAYKLIESFSILASFIFLHKSFKPYIVVYFYTLISLLLLYIIFYTNLFPPCFIYGLGQTKFKIKCEYIIILNMLTSIFLFIKNRKHFSKTTVLYMNLYLVLGILARFELITDTSVYIFFNFSSHILKFLSYYFLYKALVEKVVKDPLDLLLDDLSNKNIELNSKTLELEKTINKLNEENIKLEKIREELQISEDKYKKLLEFLPDAVLLRHEYKVIYANTAAIKLFNAKNEQELIGKSPFDLTHPDYFADLSKLLEKQKKVIKTPFSLDEYKFIALNGTIIDAELKSSSLGPEEDNLYITVIYDISERKKAEKVIKLLNEARENEKLKTEFFANLSHELRTPVNVIYSALQVMDLNCKEETTRKYNLVIKQNCYRLLRLVNNIIDSTKIDAGFLKLNLTYKNIIPVVEDIALSISSYIESKGMTLIFDTDVEEKYLDFDPDAIERIILNLLSNAVKFRRENDTININIYDKVDSILICVKDEGIGISEDQQRFIFDRFKQVDKSFTRNMEGSGIGLSLVKSLVTLHKGTITLKSKEGIGSEFIIELPVFETLKHSIKNKETSQIDIVQKINIEFSDIYS